MTTEERQANLTGYEQLCDNFKKLQENRYRLLQLLPAGTVAALGVMFGADNLGNDVRAVLCLAGSLVVTALWVYDSANTRIILRMFFNGKALEKTLGIAHGMFYKEPLQEGVDEKGMKKKASVPASLGSTALKRWASMPARIGVTLLVLFRYRDHQPHSSRDMKGELRPYGHQAALGMIYAGCVLAWLSCLTIAVLDIPRVSL